MSTYFVKAGYALGVTAGFFLQIAPLFNLFDKYILQGVEIDSELPENLSPRRRRDISIRRQISYILRAAIACLTCVLGYIAGDFAMFLNLQGALVGTFISYILPCLFYLRMLTYARALRAKDKEEENKRVLIAKKDEDDYKLTLDSYTKRTGLSQVDLATDKLDPETTLEFWQRILCYSIIAFGTIGGSISLACTTTHIGDNLF